MPPTSLATPQTTAFAHRLRERCQSVASRDGHGGFKALQLVAIIESPSKWRVLSFEAAELDRAILNACGLTNGSSFPWAHGSNWLKFLAKTALGASNSSHISCEDLALPSMAAMANAYPNSRMGNNSCMLGVQEGFGARAAARIAAAFPSSWEYCAEGMGAMPQAQDQNPLESFSLASLKQRALSDARDIYPQNQVDADGNVHWMWLPACARALGAPPLLSSSILGGRELLGLGDVYSAANKIASNDPAEFRAKFSAALIPFDAKRRPEAPLTAPPGIVEKFHQGDLAAEEIFQISNSTAQPRFSHLPKRL